MEKLFCSMCKELNEHSVYPVQGQPEHLVIICACGFAEVVRNLELDSKIRESLFRNKINSLGIIVGQIAILRTMLDQDYILAMWNGEDFFAYPDGDRILPTMICYVSKLPKYSEFTEINHD